MRRNQLLIWVRDIVGVLAISAIVVAIALLIHSLTETHEGPLPDVRSAASSIREQSVDGTPAVIAKPHHAGTSAVLFIHGYGEDQWGAFDVPLNAKLMAGFLDHGYAVAASDAYGNNWGNARSQEAVLALARKLQGIGYSHLDVVAESMGGLDGLDLLKHVQVQGWVGLSAVCNLKSMVGLFRPSVTSVYGTGLASAIAADSPLIPRGVRGLPMRWFASYTDQVVSKRLNADLCSADLHRAGADSQVITTRGNHLDPSNFQLNRMLRLFSA